MTAAADNTAASSGRILVHCLAHGAWAFGFAMAALVWLSRADSTSDINTWGMRFLLVGAIGVTGSLGIQLSWWGRHRVATVRFWASWFAVTTVCNMVGIPMAVRLFY